MFNPKKRGFLVKAAAVLAAIALTVGASPSHAQETYGPASSDVVITKLDQPTDAGAAADGTSQDPGGTPIQGVTFSAYKVPLTEIEGTEAWQNKIAGTSVSAANLAVNEAGPAITPITGTTDDNGVITWPEVPRGLYLVRETATPANVVASPDFLLAVPLTNPDNLDTWLKTIYVYPKNSVVEGEKTVVNATDTTTDDNVAWTTGGTITWTINADIPQIRAQNEDFLPTSEFRILDTLTDTQLTLPNDESSVSVTAPDGLARETHYTVELDRETTPGATVIEIEFTEVGRAALAAELPDVQQVAITIDTVVQSMGVIENEAIVYPGNNNPESFYEIDPVDVRYGNITLQKDSTDESITGEDLAGAEFMVYLSEKAAIAKVADTHVTTLSNPGGVWTTTADGSVLIEGLRYSNYANGGDVTGTPEAQTYWLVETKALEGHQLLAQPASFIVDSSNGVRTVEITNSANTNGFTLPLTGGTGTALLTLFGVILLGVVLFVARTRRNSEAA